MTSRNRIAFLSYLSPDGKLTSKEYVEHYLKESNHQKDLKEIQAFRLLKQETQNKRKQRALRKGRDIAMKI